MRRKGRPKKQKEVKVEKKKRGRPRKRPIENDETQVPRKKPRASLNSEGVGASDPLALDDSKKALPIVPDENYSEGLHMSTMQVRALGTLVSCKECGEEVVLGVRPTTKGMISEFTVSCKVCGSNKSTNTPNLIRERKRKREKKDAVLQKTENINYAHVAAYLDNGLGYSGLRHYCRYLNARCLNEATFIVYARQVIADVAVETEEFLQHNARIVRKAFETQLESDFIVDLTVSYTTTYHQWGSDFCLVAGAVIELQTGLVIDYDVANMYCHVCKINAKKIVSMGPVEMTEWFNKHQDTCEIREWCDEIDQDSDEGVKEIDPKYLEAFIAKKLWSRSIEKFGFRYSTLIHESDERIHNELLKASPYDDIPVLIDGVTNCFSRRKSEHARTSFQNKLKSKCPRERVQTKDRIMYVYAMSIPEYNKFAIGSNIKLRELVKRIDMEENGTSAMALHVAELLPMLNQSAVESEEDPSQQSGLIEEEEDDEEELDEDEEEEEVPDDEEDDGEEVEENEVDEKNILPQQRKSLPNDEVKSENKSDSISKETTANDKTDEPSNEANNDKEEPSTKNIVLSAASSREIFDDDFSEEEEKTPSKNGTEILKSKSTKEQEVVKPFRVDFDED